IYQQAPRETRLPFDVVKDWIRDRYLDNLARSALVHNLNTIRKQVEELRKTKKLADLDQYLTEQAQKLNLQTGKSPLRNLHKDPIANDPGVRPMRDAYVRGSSDPLAKFFGYVFFTQARPYEPETFPRTVAENPDPDRDPWRTAPQLF